MHDDPAAGTQPHVLGPVAGHGASGSSVRTRTPAIGERSPNARVCPFLRAIDENATLGLPVEAPDPANRCAALHDAVPQSLRQQELVCLTNAHLNCPRKLRGSLITRQRAKPAPTSPAVTPAIAVAMIVLAVAFLVSLGFVVGNGGLVLSAAAPTPTAPGDSLGEVETPVPTGSPTLAATPGPTPEPTPVATASPSLIPSPTPTASPTATPTPNTTPKPTSNRFALLKPCPDASNCYLYVVRSGDNLYSIANYFGVPLKTIQARNPWTQNGLTVGRSLRLPRPTR